MGGGGRDYTLYTLCRHVEYAMYTYICTDAHITYLGISMVREHTYMCEVYQYYRSIIVCVYVYKYM